MKKSGKAKLIRSGFGTRWRPREMSKSDSPRAGDIGTGKLPDWALVSPAFYVTSGVMLSALQFGWGFSVWYQGDEELVYMRLHSAEYSDAAFACSDIDGIMSACESALEIMKSVDGTGSNFDGDDLPF